MKKATLTTVAREAGVSKTTASLVLNDKADRVNIAVATSERVKQVAKKLNYSPGNFNPGRLNGKTWVTGVFAADFYTLRNASWLNHLIKIADQENQTIVPKLGTTENIHQLIEALPADGIIILDEYIVSPLINPQIKEVPIVCAGFYSKKLPSVVPDYDKQFNELLNGLYRRNKKAIAFLGTEKMTYDQEIKINIYTENYCQRFDIPENIALIKTIRRKEIIMACHQLVENGANAIIFSNSEIAMEALVQQPIKDMVNKGILLACPEHVYGWQLLPEGLLLTIEEDIEVNARKVMAEILKK